MPQTRSTVRKGNKAKKSNQEESPTIKCRMDPPPGASYPAPGAKAPTTLLAGANPAPITADVNPASTSAVGPKSTDVEQPLGQSEHEQIEAEVHMILYLTKFFST